MSGTESGLSCLRLLASVQLNSNMSESLRHLCVPPCVRCVHCVPCLPLYVFHCAKIDSVLTQPTQGKKRIVGARLYATILDLNSPKYSCISGKNMGMDTNIFLHKMRYTFVIISFVCESLGLQNVVIGLGWGVPDQILAPN